MREKNRKPIASYIKLPQFTTMNVIDGQAGVIIYSSLICYSLTIDNILNIIVLLILAGVTIVTLTGDNGLLRQADKAKMLTEIGEIEEKVKLKTLENKNQQLIEGSLDSIDLDISENLINKYKNIVYVKDSKLYLSFIANYPQINLYKNNKEKIEALKGKLEITYDSIKAYNKVINPSFNDGLNNWYKANGSNNIIEILNEEGNNYAHLDMKYKEGGYTTYIYQLVNNVANYNDKIYINTKYRNRTIETENNYKINNTIIRIHRGRRRVYKCITK